MTEKTKRNSALELLRIFSMIMIIFCHYSSHGGYETFGPEDYSFSVGYLKTLSEFGSPACSIFAMITGYFMVNAECKEGFCKKIVPLIFRMLFCSFFVFGVVVLLKGEWKLMDLVGVSFPYLFCNNWYVYYYVEFFFFIPFINRLIENMSKRDFRKILLIVLVFYFVLTTIPKVDFSSGNLFFMLNMYLIGAYYRKYGKEDFGYNNRTNLIVSLICFVLMIGSVWVISYIGYRLNNETIFSYANYFGSYKNILSLGFSFFIFAYFANKEFYNPMINLIASTTLSIYMLHDNGLILQFEWLKWSANAANIDNVVIHSLIKCICIFVICMLIDLLRQITIDKLFRKFVYPKVYAFIDRISESSLMKKYFHTGEEDENQYYSR